MDNFKLYIFGPANGAIAFTLPDEVKSDDDTVFLASSEYLLNEKGSIIKIERFQNSQRQAVVRCAVYQQVYEPNLSRLGQSFGAMFEFSEYAPDSRVLANTLLEIYELIRAYCVKDNTFIDYPNFHNFFKSQLAPVFRGISAQLFGTSKNQRIVSAGWDSSEVGGCITIPEISVAAINQFAEWMLFNPGSLACDRLLVVTGDSGEANKNLKRINHLSELDGVALKKFYDRVLQIEGKILEKNNMLAKKKSELDAIKQNLQEMDNRCSELISSNTQLDLENKSLRREMNDNSYKIGSIQFDSVAQPQRRQAKIQPSLPQEYMRYHEPVQDTFSWVQIIIYVALGISLLGNIVWVTWMLLK